MITAITILHVVACFFLIVVVLLQTGKGADAGAVFGGGASQTMFGASGAGNLLTKLTTGTAVVFFCTSLTLAYSSLAERTSSVFDDTLPEPPPRSAPIDAAPVDTAPVDTAPVGEVPAAAAPTSDEASEGPAADAAEPAPEPLAGIGEDEPADPAASDPTQQPEG